METQPAGEKYEMEELSSRVMTIMRKVLPPQFTVDEDAAELMSLCVRELASAICCEALTCGALDSSPKLTGSDICAALKVLGMDPQHSSTVHMYLCRRQEHLLHCKICAFVGDPSPTDAGQSADHQSNAKTAKVKKPRKPSKREREAEGDVATEVSGQEKDKDAEDKTVDKAKEGEEEERADKSRALEKSQEEAVEEEKDKEGQAPKKRKNQRKNWDDPTLPEQIMASLTGCSDQGEMLKRLAKQFNMTLRDMKKLVEQMGIPVGKSSSST